MKPSILGIGSVSALGCGISTIKEGLLAERRPNIEKKRLLTAEGEKTLPVYSSTVEGLDRFIPRNKLRRVDPFLQMGLLSSYLAFEDSGIEIEDKSRVGIIFGTGFGPLQTSFSFFDTLIDDGDKCASPTLFANSVHNSMVSNVSIALKIEGPCQTLTCFDMTTAAVFSTASSWIESGVVDYVLAGVGDEYCEVRGYATLLSGSKNKDCSYLPGEGFVAFLLGGENRQGYGTIDNVKTGRIKDLDFSRADAHFLAANGDSGTGTYYDQIGRGNAPHFSYSHLYGGMPVGQGFDVAIAALSIKEGNLYSPLDGSEKKNAPGLKKVDCIQCDDNGSAGVITVSAYN